MKEPKEHATFSFIAFMGSVGAITMIHILIFIMLFIFNPYSEDEQSNGQSQNQPSAIMRFIGGF